VSAPIRAEETTGSARTSGSSEALPSLIELSDDEIVAWLTTSILDEDDEHGRPLEAENQDFWDRVAEAEAGFAALGFEGPAALDRAIGLVGVDVSLGTTNAVTPGEPSSLLDIPQSSLGEDELLRLHAEIMEPASRAIAAWATLQGSALRAASQSKG
jgi:hypothetical protein